jgi:predicted nucleic acid-binding protein
MIVVADTAPLNYLIQIDCDGLLPKLYGRIVVPVSVVQELGHAAAPAAVRRWLVWVFVRR